MDKISDPAMSEDTLLIVDDEYNILNSLKRTLRREGYKILSAESGVEGLELLQNNTVGVILSDQRMPKMSGIEFLKQVKQTYPDTIRMVLSGYTDLDSVADAINQGAIFKFLSKPWEDDLLRANIKDAFRVYNLYIENQRLDNELKILNQRLENRVDEQNHESQLKLKVLQSSQQIVDALPIGILGIAENDFISMANTQVHTILNQTQGNLLGVSASRILPETLQLIYKTMGSQESERYEKMSLFDKNYTIIAKRISHETSIQGTILTIVSDSYF